MSIIQCPECGSEISDRAEKCPNCGYPIQSVTSKSVYQSQQSEMYPKSVVVKPYMEKKSHSVLGILALIFSILGCTFWLGIILAIIDLCKKDDKKKTCSIIGLIISCIWFLLIVFISALPDSSNVPSGSEMSSEQEDYKIEDTGLENAEDKNKTVAYKDEISYEDMYLSSAPDDENNILKSVDVESEKLQNGDVVVFVTNNNPFVIPDLNIQILFYKNGNIVDTGEDGHDVLVPKNTVISKLGAPDNYDNYEVNVTVSWEYGSSYRNWIYNINVEPNVGEDCIIVQFENVGEIDIEELEYIIVFYKENVVVDTSYAKDIADVKAGDKVIENVSTAGIEFDEYEVYINQAHTFSNEYGDVVSDKIPENIGKNFKYEKEITNKMQSEDKEESENDVTVGKKNALKSAKNYLLTMPFSYNGLVEQLEYEKYSHEEAVYAADNCGANWNEQASNAAKNYLDFMSFSKEGLIDQLEYDGFTYEQAIYGAQQNGY